ncbi:cytochrome p450, partial [Trifolium pratense]
GLTRACKKVGKSLDDVLEVIITEHEQATNVQKNRHEDFVDILLSMMHQSIDHQNEENLVIDHQSIDHENEDHQELNTCVQHQGIVWLTPSKNRRSSTWRGGGNNTRHQPGEAVLRILRPFWISGVGGRWWTERGYDLVLAAQYGVEGGRLREGGQRGSSWWREITRIRERGGEPGGSWFGEHVLRRVGDESDTFF